MKKLFTLLTTVLFALGAFAATEPAWYNDVTSIAANGQYYIYSVNGAGFVQAGQKKVKSVTTNNYTSTSDLLFTFTGTTDANTYNGSNYLSSFQAGTCGPTGKSGKDGVSLTWVKKTSAWQVYGSYSFIWSQKAYLYYEDGYAAKTNSTPGDNDTKYQWLLISQAHYDRHWAIYLYERYKDNISDYTKYEGKVPSAYYEALAAAYAVTYNVQNADHSKEVVNAHRADLKALYDNAAAVEQAYANAVAAIEALEGVEDKGDGDTDKIDQDISNAYAAIDEAMSVDALNAAVSAPALKAIDPITFNTTTFTALQPLGEPASTVAGRAITYLSEDFTIINEAGLPIYKGEVALKATAAETDEYYEFVRLADVTVEPISNIGVDKLEGCEGDVLTYEGDEYAESAIQEYTFENITGGDSIVTLTVIFHQPTEGEEFMTITYGEAAVWHEQDLSELPVGEHDLYFDTKNVAGCDSTVTLKLTVNKLDTLKVPVELNFCEGGSVWYRETEYAEAGQFEVEAEGEIRDTLYQINVTMLLPTEGEEFMTITYGEAAVWHEQDLSELPVGEHDLYFDTKNVAGCDSTVTLKLTVNKLDTLKVPVELNFCEGGSVWYRETEYAEAGQFEVEAEGEIRDTLYQINVTMLLPTEGEEFMTITYGEAAVWHEQDLSELPVGEHDLYFDTKNVAGCDSTVTLKLTVNKLDTLKVPVELNFCEGGSVWYRETEYAEAGQFEVEAEGEIRDTLYMINVAKNTADFVELNIDSLHVGEMLIIGEGEWYLGEELLTEPEYQQTEVREFDIIQTLVNEFGCDSVIVRHVVVEEPVGPTGFEAVEGVKTAIKELRDGVIYIRRGEGLYTTDGKRIK